MPGNPFKTARDTEGGLLGGQGLRSDDQWDDHDLNQPLDAAGASSAAGAAASGAAGGAATAAAVPPAAPEAAQRAAAPPAVTAAEEPLPPAPPPIATASFIPPPLATQPPPTIGVPASTAGAWGAAQPAQQPGVWGVSSSQFDSSGPAGYPPPAAPYGAYGAGAPGFQPQPWTGGYSDQPLTCEQGRCCAGQGQIALCVLCDCPQPKPAWCRRLLSIGPLAEQHVEGTTQSATPPTLRSQTPHSSSRLGRRSSRCAAAAGASSGPASSSAS